NVGIGKTFDCDPVSPFNWPRTTLEQDRFRWNHIASNATSRLKRESCSTFRFRARFTFLDGSPSASIWNDLALAWLCHRSAWNHRGRHANANWLTRLYSPAKGGRPAVR